MKNFVFVIALAFLSVSAFGQKVNFSGEWKLDEQQSMLGDQFSLAPKTLTVDHAKKTLDLKSVNEFDGQEYTSEQHYTLDGAECENTGFMESLTKSTVTADKKANTITIVTHGSVQGSDYTLTQTLSMKDGNLVMDSEATSDMGEMMETYVFIKQ
jgi:hypothetical protein